jgi:hypothetical protein
MKNSFAPIFTSMLDSSIWQEPYTVRLVWIAMLPLKEADHVVRYNAFQIARRANMTEQEVIDALKVLESPDTRRIEPQPYEGRRIQRVPDGWLILNGQKFEDLMRTLSTRAYNARKQREYRGAKKGKSGPSGLAGEAEHLRMEANGATQEQLDRHEEEHLERITKNSIPEIE